MTPERMAMMIEKIIIDRMKEEFDDVIEFTPSIKEGRRYIGLRDEEFNLDVAIQIDVLRKGV